MTSIKRILVLLFFANYFASCQRNKNANSGNTQILPVVLACCEYEWNGVQIETEFKELENFNLFFNTFLFAFATKKVQFVKKHVLDSVYVPRILDLNPTETVAKKYSTVLDSALSQDEFMDSVYLRIVNDNIIKEIAPLNLYRNLKKFENNSHLQVIASDSIVYQVTVGYMGESKFYYRFFFVKRNARFHMYGLAKLKFN